tara:strand:- start:5833 stop:6030 length:198 start_codon:yes stop_codon:yes gene_type:complete
MINKTNFYQEFDLIFNKIQDNNKDKIYNELILLYENYLFNRIDNNNLISDLTVKTFNIDTNGCLL